MTNLDYALLATRAAVRSGLTEQQIERAAYGRMRLVLRAPVYRVEAYHVPWLERWRNWRD